MRQKGFTLIEVIVAISIFSVIIWGVAELVSGILVNSNQSQSLLDQSDSARKIAFSFTSELRNATTSANGAYALESATNQQIIFYTKTSSTVDRVRYYLQSGNLYKGVTKPTGNPAVYNIATETVNLIQKKVANEANPLFYYYNGNYNGVSGTALPQPVNVTTVKFVQIKLSIYKNLNPSSNASYTVTASGTIRNLKSNLGN